MLVKFSVNNYKGFSTRLEWDLSHPSSYTFNDFAVKEGVVKNGIIYGPNGSGKTNLGLSIFDIANHLSHKWKKPDYYLNYACASCPSRPVDFEYNFVFDGRRVSYCYSKVAVDMRGVLVSENLTVDGEELLHRDGDDIRISEAFGVSEAAKKNLRAGANNISIVNFLLNAVPLEDGHVLIRLRDFVENMLFFRSLDYREFIGLKEDRSNIEEYIIRQNLVGDFADFLEKTSGQHFDFYQPALDDSMLYCVFDGFKIPFSLVASTGTLNLELQYFWLKEMVEASFVYIDEFDAFYHHELSYAICRLLFHNRNQVFVSTHDTFLLSNDLLRPDCFFILKDNRIDAVCNLTEKELRLGHNLEKLYRGGAFGS